MESLALKNVVLIILSIELPEAAKILHELIFGAGLEISNRSLKAKM